LQVTGSNDGNVSGNHGGIDAWIAKLAGSDGVQAIDSNNKIDLFPNPAINFIQLHIPSLPTIISFFNLLGEKVKEQTITGSDITIDVSELPAGIYEVRVGEWSGKFVKE
jgi:hypothetical protein